ncbi:MAG: sugar phosphate nucleotidyltransferase [Dethiobacteraceae bacterium]|jgi:mannose-1-phosphate guanylyltransferase/phosphomannomutase|nr:NTP transferase domain-containing protein [Bacillota bacterium]
MKAIIMAGGEGSRLRPLTCGRPKPMVPLIDRPLMEHIVALLQRQGLTEIGVTLQYLPWQIKNHFRDGREFGVDMRYFIEHSPLGTAGSVKNAASFLDDTFLVISGDALTDFDLQQAIEFHRQKGGLATLVLTTVEKPLEYGVVITNADGQITQFLEKPGWGEVFSDTVNTGIYILEPEILKFIPAAAKFDFSRDLFPLLMAKGYPLYGFVAAGYWCDIGNLQQYHQAHLDMLSGKVDIKLQTRETAPGIYVGEDVVIEPGVRLEAPVFIGSGARLREGAVVADASVIGSYTEVDAYASVKRSLIWRNSYLAPHTEIRGAIIGDCVQVRQGSALFEGVVVGDHSVLEEHCTIKPRVKIWPHKRIASGSIVAESIVWGTKPVQSLFGNDGITGIVNLEITPELVAKVAAAYGSLVGEGSQVVVSSDDWKASRMLKAAALAGLLSAGVQVYDLDVSVTPITRQAVKQLRVKGGIHVQLSQDVNTKTRLQFFDDAGLPLTKSWERKIEQTYYREDFKRIKGLAVGESINFAQYADSYRDSLLQSLELSVFAKQRRKILLAYPTPWLYTYLLPVLQHLNCEVITLSAAGGEPLTLQMLQQQFSNAAAAVQRLQADLGVLMDGNAEKLVLFTPAGRVITDELFRALIAMIIFHSRRGSTMAVPVTAPAVIDKIAAVYQGRVMRTKTAPRSLMEALAAEGGSQKYDPFTLSFDAIAALLKILEYLAAEETDLTALVDKIPPFYLHQCEVECSWEAKGAVMRRLIEETRGKEVELLDGVKVKHPQGWALVLPDSEKPVYRIFSEGYSAEAAEELTDFYVQRIKQYQGELGK